MSQQVLILGHMYPIRLVCTPNLFLYYSMSARKNALTEDEIAYFVENLDEIESEDRSELVVTTVCKIEILGQKRVKVTLLMTTTKTYTDSGCCRRH